MVRRDLIGIGIGIFALGVGLGAVFADVNADSAVLGSRQIRSEQGKYTNPLLECDIARGVLDAPKTRFQRSLTNELQAIEREHPGLVTAVYFRDLNNGPTMGYRENEPFIPASLIKVLVAMALYKHEEREPGFLATQVTYEGIEVPAQDYEPAMKLEKGKSYPLEELITRSIQYSDNEAALALGPYVTDAELRELTEVLGISYENDVLSVKDYSGAFRVLYNASFLSQASSEKVLGILAESSFKDGMRAGVPEGTPLAAKFGQRSLPGTEQLHECGIVYYPQHPYLLCIMSRSADAEQLSPAIARISRFVYENTDQIYGTAGKPASGGWLDSLLR